MEISLQGLSVSESLHVFATYEGVCVGGSNGVHDDLLVEELRAHLVNQPNNQSTKQTSRQTGIQSIRQAINQGVRQVR